MGVLGVRQARGGGVGRGRRRGGGEVSFAGMAAVRVGSRVVVLWRAEASGTGRGVFEARVMVGQSG